MTLGWRSVIEASFLGKIGFEVRQMHGRRTITDRQQRQRLQWRKRKAEQRERAKHPLFPGSKRKDPVSIVPVPLPRSIIDNFAARLIAEHGRDEMDLPTREYNSLIGILAAHDLIKMFRK